MTKATGTKTFSLGNFLSELRKRKGVSLKEVENDTGIPNAYLSQLETGSRKKLPNPERLRILADYFNVSVPQLLEKAGYIQSGEMEETMEGNIDKAFTHVVNDPTFRHGSRLKGKYDLDAKRFIIEMYEQLTNKTLLDYNKSVRFATHVVHNNKVFSAKKIGVHTNLNAHKI